MGCFHTSCQVSGLSIPAGEQMVGIPIANIYEQWSPCLLPIFGEYNDYGSVENVEVNLVSNIINRKVREFLKTEKYECDETLSGDSIDDVAEFLQHSNIRYVSHQGNTTITMCHVSREIYDLMVNSCWSEYESWQKDRILYRFEAYKTSMINYTPNNLYPNRILDDVSTYMPGIFGLWFENELDDIDSEQRRELALKNIEFCQFIYMFNKMRKVFSPPAQQGSQTENYDLIISMNKEINKIAKQYKKRFD